jgi:hypothetical protein
MQLIHTHVVPASERAQNSSECLQQDLGSSLSIVQVVGTVPQQCHSLLQMRPPHPSYCASFGKWTTCFRNTVCDGAKTVAVPSNLDGCSNSNKALSSLRVSLFLPSHAVQPSHGVLK